MLKVICPVDGTIHHADYVHNGKMLRCSKCGMGLPIGSAATDKTTLVRSIPGNWSLIRTAGKGKFKITALAAAVVAVLALVFWFHGHPVSGGGAQIQPERSSVDATRPIRIESTPAGPSIDPSFAGVTDPQHLGEEIRRTLKTGTRVRPDIDVGGLGILTIDNTGGQDATVRVISSPVGRRVRDVFIQRGSKVNLKNMQPGDFLVRFAIGIDWDASARTFTRDRAFFEFGSRLNFVETKSKDGVEYSHKEITLYRRPDGNVKSEPITEQMFDSQ